MQAFIFDLNGTMVHDMEYHTRAWQRLFNENLGGSFSWEEVKLQMYGKNREVLVRLFGPDRFSGEEMDRLGMEKERRYQEEFRPQLALLPGQPVAEAEINPLIVRHDSVVAVDGLLVMRDPFPEHKQ